MDNQQKIWDEVRKAQTLIKTHQSSILTLQDKIKNLWGEL